MSDPVFPKAAARIVPALMALALTGGNGAAQIQPPTPSSAAPAPAEPAAAPESSSDISYDRADRMLLNVTVNQQQGATFMVDTGSERTVISDALAERLGIAASGRATIASVAGTASVATARIDQIGFDKVSVDNLVTPVLKREHMGADGLIGVDSLQQKLVLFDFDKREMHIRPSKRRSAERSYDPDEIVVTGKPLHGRLIFADARIDGVRVTVVVDSGAQYSIGNPALLAKLTERRKIKTPIVTTLHSVTGQSVDATLAFAGRVHIGALQLRGMPIAYTGSPAFTALELDDEPALLLGMNTLRAFRQVEVDFANRRVRFVTPGGASRTPDTRYACASAQCGQALPSI